MEMPFSFLSLEGLPFVIITLIIAFSVHEFSHAYVAYKFGDPTAKNQGRLTLSPLKHLDPVGSIMLILLGFGWAKPVPVNRFFFKNPRLAGVLVSVAGPLSNLVLAFLGFILMFIFIRIGIFSMIPSNVADSLEMFFGYFIRINISLFVFNLLPFPPLDGYRIMEDLAPPKVRARLTQYEHYGIIIFLILVITPLDAYTITPIFQTVIPFVESVLSTMTAPILEIGS
ncbi:site-2 protease family protein [Bacillus sp. DJP31]|uniref:site-2 protease family protein n=1 Tax=Bacillus sp. DJP31 TaxID=3409789 RepID=UPI003BB61DC2